MLFWPLILKKFAVSGKQVLAWILTARIYPVSLRRNVRSHHARQNSPNCLPNEKNRVRRDSNLGHPLYFNPLPPFRSASRSSFLSHRSLSLSLFFFLCFFFFRESRLAFSASKKSTHASKSYSRKKSRVKDIFRIFGVKLLLKSSFFISIRLSLSFSLSLCFSVSLVRSGKRRFLNSTIMMRLEKFQEREIGIFKRKFSRVSSLGSTDSEWIIVAGKKKKKKKKNFHWRNPDEFLRDVCKSVHVCRFF